MKITVKEVEAIIDQIEAESGRELLNEQAYYALGALSVHITNLLRAGPSAKYTRQQFKKLLARHRKAHPEFHAPKAAPDVAPA